MNDTKDPKNEFHKALFTNLIMMLTSSAMQQLGKLVNPVTNKTEINLEGAQITIDMLDMLKGKTEGNLDDDEKKFISDALATLQMNYVQAAAKAGSAENPEPAKQPDAKPETSDTPPPPAADKQEPKNPKFRKSYGA